MSEPKTKPVADQEEFNNSRHRVGYRIGLYSCVTYSIFYFLCILISFTNIFLQFNETLTHTHAYITEIVLYACLNACLTCLCIYISQSAKHDTQTHMIVGIPWRVPRKALARWNLCVADWWPLHTPQSRLVQSQWGIYKLPCCVHVCHTTYRLLH